MNRILNNIMEKYLEAARKIQIVFMLVDIWCLFQNKTKYLHQGIIHELSSHSINSLILTNIPVILGSVIIIPARFVPPQFQAVLPAWSIIWFIQGPVCIVPGCSIIPKPCSICFPCLSSKPNAIRKPHTTLCELNQELLSFPIRHRGEISIGICPGICICIPTTWVYGLWPRVRFVEKFVAFFGMIVVFPPILAYKRWSNWIVCCFWCCCLNFFFRDWLYTIPSFSYQCIRLR